MGRLFLVELEGRGIYTCRRCNAHLAYVSDIISRDFLCNNGKAFLFDNVVNITLGENEERSMMSGLHTVADIFCVCCESILGWKYVKLKPAPDKSEHFKEGKFILDRSQVLSPLLVNVIYN